MGYFHLLPKQISQVRQERIVIEDYRPIGWNQFYRGLKWHYRKKMVDEVRAIVLSSIYKEGNEFEMFTCPVDIEITCYYVSHPHDSSNICAKIYEDALKGIFIEDDSPKYVRSMKTSSLIDRQHPRLEIIIKEST